MPKATTPVAADRQARRHNPLEHDLTATGPLKTKSGKRKSRSQDDEEKFVDSKASRKILRIGQELADEDEAENQVTKPNSAFDFESRFEDEDEQEPFEDQEAWGDEEEEVEFDELSPVDQAMFAKFMPEQEDELLKTGWGGQAEEEEEGTTNLADLILEKIAEKEAREARLRGSGNQEPGPVDEDFEIPAKVVEVYTKYVCRGDLERSIANWIPELVSFCQDTSLESSRNHSRSCLLSLIGKISSTLPDPKNGHQTQSSRLPKSLFRVRLQPHKGLWKWWYLAEYERKYMKRRS